MEFDGLFSSCKYIATNVNHAQLLDDDDSMGENIRTYLVIGNEIKFPQGVHKTPIDVIYANDGLSLNEDDVFIDDAIGAIIRTKLIDIYKSHGEEDLTNNSNSKK